MKEETVVKMILDAWNARITQLDRLFTELPDEQLQLEIAPGRNRGIYLLGHLTAINNYMLPLLGFGKEIAPHLFKTFVQTADKDIVDLPSVKELRQEWTNVNTALANHFVRMQPDDWFQKHTAVSDEEFAKQPHRNKLNVIISRTNHLDYHAGQLVLLKSKAEKK